MKDWQWYVLDINPEPWAIGPLSVIKRGGKYIPIVGRNTQLHYYKEAIRESIQPEDEMMVGPVRLIFYFWRQQAEYKTPQARTHRKHEADVTNLQKATEDALQGVLFKNDKDTVEIQSIMVEQGPNVKGQVVIGIQPVMVDPRMLVPTDIKMLIEERNEDMDNFWGIVDQP